MLAMSFVTAFPLSTVRTSLPGMKQSTGRMLEFPNTTGS
jgi:hypothetical protein